MFYTKPGHREVKKPAQLGDGGAGFKYRNFGSRVSSYKVRGWQTKIHGLNLAHCLFFTNKVLLAHNHAHLLTYCLWLLCATGQVVLLHPSSARSRFSIEGSAVPPSCSCLRAAWKLTEACSALWLSYKGGFSHLERLPFSFLWRVGLLFLFSSLFWNLM